MVSWFIPLFLAGVFFAVFLTIIPLHNIENESYFEYDKPPSGWAPRYKAVLGVKSENAYIMI